MGWLWDSSAPKQSADKNNKLETTATIPSTTDSQLQSTTPSNPSTPATPAMPMAAAEQAESDFDLMLREFQTTSASSSSSPTSSTATQSQSQPQSPSHSQSQTTTPPSSSQWTPSILHPTSMSCTSAFDQAMYCQIIGGQFANYYRYGSLRNCGELWSNFWFCMRTNRGFMSDDERECRIQAFYMAREARLNKEGSSEDVWAPREEADIRPFAEQQFRWDLRRFEAGQAVLREQTR